MSKTIIKAHTDKAGTSIGVENLNSDAFQVDSITDKAGTGAPDFPQGLTNNGQPVITAEATENNLGLVKKAKHLFAVQTTDATHSHNTTEDVIFGTVVSNTFDSGDYNSTTGIFTVPETGIYSLNIELGYSDADDSQHMFLYQTRLVINGTTYILTQNHFGTTTLLRATDRINTALALTAGDTIKVTGLAITSNSGDITFAGTTSTRQTFIAITKIA